MNKVKKLFVNKGSTVAYAISTVIIAIIPEDLLKTFRVCALWSDYANVIINRLFIIAIIFAGSNFIYCCYRRSRKKVFVGGINCTIQVEYGDILNISDGKKIINFDECFTTKIGDAPAEIKRESVCGRYLKKHPIDNIHQLIEQEGINPAKGKSKYNDQIRYKPGTIIPNGEYLLTAFAKLDQNGLGYLSYDEYIECLNNLWDQIDRYHGTCDVYMPILGSHITRFDKELTQQQLLDIIIGSYKLSPKRMRKPYILHIVCKPRDGFSLNDIIGIE